VTRLTKQIPMDQNQNNQIIKTRNGFVKQFDWPLEKIQSLKLKKPSFARIYVSNSSEIEEAGHCRGFNSRVLPEFMSQIPQKLKKPAIAGD
jgi:hypothetical protein